MAQAVQQVAMNAQESPVGDQQLPLSRAWTRPSRSAKPSGTPMCAGCRAREARYGFRTNEDDPLDRPRTLCFECFRLELVHRQAVASQRARGWNAEQGQLPLEETLNALRLRRRRAQIAARHALGL
jgi:hypothetical protein